MNSSLQEELRAALDRAGDAEERAARAEMLNVQLRRDLQTAKHAVTMLGALPLQAPAPRTTSEVTAQGLMEGAWAQQRESRQRKGVCQMSPYGCWLRAGHPGWCKLSPTEFHHFETGDEWDRRLGEPR